MQGGQGRDETLGIQRSVRREGNYRNEPPSPDEYRKLTTRVVELHPITLMQNARTSGGGVVTGVPGQALTVGPVQTWKAEKVSIWHAGTHDNAFGQRLTALMISKRIEDSSYPCPYLQVILMFSSITSGVE
jgi:glucosamine-6-phosphate deaminase